MQSPCAECVCGSAGLIFRDGAPWRSLGNSQTFLVLARLVRMCSYRVCGQPMIITVVIFPVRCLKRWWNTLPHTRLCGWARLGYGLINLPFLFSPVLVWLPLMTWRFLTHWTGRTVHYGAWLCKKWSTYISFSFSLLKRRHGTNIYSPLSTYLK